MPYYTHKSLPVFAIQYTGQSAAEIKKMFTYKEDQRFVFAIDKGDYIVNNHTGALSVMSKEEFEERYAPQTPSPL